MMHDLTFGTHATWGSILKLTIPSIAPERYAIRDNRNLIQLVCTYLGTSKGG